MPESTLASWTGPASDAEDERHDNARRAITDAIPDSSAFDGADLSIYAKGSYPNHTNVVRDSDVNVAVEMTSIIYLAFEHDAAGMAKEDFAGRVECEAASGAATIRASLRTC